MANGKLTSLPIRDTGEDPQVDLVLDINEQIGMWRSMVYELKKQHMLVVANLRLKKNSLKRSPDLKEEIQPIIDKLVKQEEMAYNEAVDAIGELKRLEKLAETAPARAEPPR